MRSAIRQTALVSPAGGHPLPERRALLRRERLPRERQHRGTLSVHVAAIEPCEAPHILALEPPLAGRHALELAAQRAPQSVHRAVLALELLDGRRDLRAALRGGELPQQGEQVLILVPVVQRAG